MIEDCGGDPDDMSIPEERWSPIEEGITFAQQLSAYIELHPNTVENTTGILSDFHEFTMVLECAQKIQAKWHLSVDM